MKNNLILIVALTIFANIAKAQQVKPVYLLYGEEIKGNISEDDTVKIILSGKAINMSYRFSKVSCEYLLSREFVIDYNSKMSPAAQRNRLREGPNPVSLEKYISIENSFKKNPKITIPFKKFYHQCLSRVIIHIEEVEFKPINKSGPIRRIRIGNSTDLKPNWVCPYDK